MFLDHFPVNRVQGFLSTKDFGFHPRLCQFIRQTGQDSLHHFLTVATHGLHCTCQNLITMRIDILERQILQFPKQRIQAKAVGYWRVNLQGFPGNTPPLIGTHGTQSLHVMQPVRELDQNDADITRHGQQHFAEVFCLRFVLARKLEAIQFGQPFHQFGHRLTETLC